MDGICTTVLFLINLTPDGGGEFINGAITYIICHSNHQCLVG